MSLTGKRRRRISLENENLPSLSAFYNGFKVELNRSESHLHSFLWVIPRRLNFMCRLFGTLCSIFVGGVGVFIQEEGFGSKIFLSQTFSCINTPKIAIRLFFQLTPLMKMEQSVPKLWHVKFRSRGITQKKEYNIQNKTEVWNQEWITIVLQICVRIEVMCCDLIVH